ncbi:MAG: hypothetical protein NUV46_01790 [Nanoarchaeota archaeon]|nr:hypothetical protein [Nanoarchaeota archaeon]
MKTNKKENKKKTKNPKTKNSKIKHVLVFDPRKKEWQYMKIYFLPGKVEKVEKVLLLNYSPSEFSVAFRTYKENGGNLLQKQIKLFQKKWKKDFVDSDFFNEL